jgi:DNA mismatch repair protein MutS2
MKDTLLDQGKKALEWDRLLEIVASHAKSSLGADRCRRMTLSPELEQAQERLAATSQMAAFREPPDSFPSLSFPDIHEPLLRAEKGAPMEAVELRDCSSVLTLVIEVTKFLDHHVARAPVLYDLGEPLRLWLEAKGLKRKIDDAIDVDGSIRESATPDLRRLTRHAHDLKQNMRDRLETILQSKRYSELLQESFFAQREGRYVVPIKAEMRGRLPGIVHDISASGATVFLEPRELVDLNNAIKVADLEVEREVRRILRELSAAVAKEVGPFRRALDVLAELDCIAAKASFSHQIGAHPVQLNDRGHVDLKQARHPLLVLVKEGVVANDIRCDASVKVLVISGPNTGGKTVTLKIVGLFALMVQAGLHLPCEPESDMALFPEVFADIGDAQDLSKDLSSFSAHMTKMIQLLGEAGVPSRAGSAEGAPVTSLVLLDEPVTSTDPSEGAALAQALLIRFAELGIKVVATTHYNELKALAHTRRGFANASVEFDVATLSPTYRLLMGRPGGSSAIEIAGRLGMEPSLLQEARRILESEDQAVEIMLADLQKTQVRLSRELEQAQAARQEAEKSQAEAKAVRMRLETTEREERRSIKKKLMDELLRARADIQATLDSLKRERTVAKAKESKQRLANLGQATRLQMEPEKESIPMERLQAGDHVELITLGVTGTLLEAPTGKKRVRVRVGEGEVSVPVAQVVGRVICAEEEKKRQTPSVGRQVSLTSQNRDIAEVLDVRGQAADEALDHLIAQLDQGVLAGVPMLRVIHGHGTGRLKSVLRDYLKESPYVASFRPGHQSEGGDGVTIVELK